jgi:hypothetical protein
MQTGRRLALAKWITDPDHPLTARVMVNRIWKHHFQNGLVKSLGNFGRSGTPPTHPELLDWLAREFIESGWSVKAMHRLIMTSATYRQSSASGGERLRIDPQNELHSRFPLKRLEAEAVRDTLLMVSGRLDLTCFGPPDAVEVHEDGLVTSIGGEGGWRRSIYVRQRRRDIPTILESFDLPAMNPNCLERPTSTVATQALHLLNDRMVHELAESFARRVAREAGPEAERRIDRLYWLALSRPPSPEEMQIALEALRALEQRWAAQASGGQQHAPDSSLRALGNVCHALFNSAAFVYVD